jgi:hypothetical protein
MNTVNAMCMEYISVHTWSLIFGSKDNDAHNVREKNVAPTLEGDLAL